MSDTSQYNFFRHRPRLRQYVAMQPEVRELVDYTIRESLKPNPVLRLPRMIGTKQVKCKNADLWSWDWIDLLELREALQAQILSDVFRLVYGIKEKDLMRLEVFNVFAAYKWIVNQVNEISVIERDRLASEMSPEEKEAGAEALQEFGYTVAVDSLANGDVLKHSDILRKKYSIIFRQLYLLKVKNDIAKSYQENVSRKNRGNRASA